MKALTVHQPWAWALIYADKVENRTWGTSYRGPVAIHAGLQVSREGVDHELLRPEWSVAHGYVHVTDRQAEISYPDRATTQAPNRLAAVLPLGAVIGVADLVDVHPCHHLEDGTGCCDPWGEHEYVDERALCDPQPKQLPVIQHWVFDNRRPLPEPIPCRGRQQLWHPPAEVLIGIREQLQEVTTR